MFKQVKLRTEISLNKKPYPKFSYESKWCGIGSCFSDNLLGLLENCGFSVCRNPSGIVYNSFSIWQIIDHAIKKKIYTKKDFFEHDGRWHSWNHHGSFSNAKLETAVENANMALAEFTECLEKASVLVLTPSSSVVYCLKDNGLITANCHKVNNNCFERKILSYSENKIYLQKIVEAVLVVNPDCKIIFTLSPVRHYPGDLALNSRSKANLMSALRDICDEFAEKCIYFPSYEILNDELRDYRFYKKDMMHPSELAVELICSRFIDTFFEAEAITQMKKALAENKFKNHRAIK